MTDQTVTVEELLQIGSFLKKWSNVTLPKISWCIARNAVIVEGALDTFRSKTEFTDEMKRFQDAIGKHRTEKYGPDALDASQIDELTADIDKMRLEDEWKQAREDEDKRKELLEILVKEDSGVNLYKISAENFEKYNVGKDGMVVIPTMAVAFMIKFGLITVDDDDGAPAVNGPQAGAEA